MVDQDEAMDCLNIITDCKLERNDHFDDCTLEELSEVYNGCGPEWLPAKLRSALTAYFHFFSPAFMIHDWDFAFLSKTKRNFDIANRRLWRNCLRLIRKRIKWWNIPLRLWRLRQAFTVWRACARLGHSAFFAKPTQTQRHMK